MKVKSVKRAASIKKYNLVCVLFPHWMAAGCSPIKEVKRVKIKLEDFLINSNFIFIYAMRKRASERTLFALF